MGQPRFRCESVHPIILVKMAEVISDNFAASSGIFWLRNLFCNLRCFNVLVSIES